jgi:hypothetical protein
MIQAVPIPRDWFDYTSFVVARVGLVFTLWAVQQATGAKKAATEAREVIFRREISFVIAEILSLTLDLAGHIEADRLMPDVCDLSICPRGYPERRPDSESCWGRILGNCLKWRKFSLRFRKKYPA